MGEPKCIYCGTSKDLSDSDIIPDALTASRIINKCVCHVEHNSGMTKKFESEVAEKLAFLLNYLNIKSKKSNHFPTYEADYVIAGIRYHDKKVVKEHDFINKKILWSENNESAFGPYEKIEQIAKSKKTNKGDIEQIDINTQVIESHIPLKYEVFFSEAMHRQVAKIAYEWYCLKNKVEDKYEDLLNTDVIHKRGLKRFVEDNIGSDEIKINGENIGEHSIFYYYILYKFGESEIQTLDDKVVEQFIINLFNTRKIDSKA